MASTSKESIKFKLNLSEKTLGGTLPHEYPLRRCTMASCKSSQVYLYRSFSAVKE